MSERRWTLDEIRKAITEPAYFGGSKELIEALEASVVDYLKALPEPRDHSFWICSECLATENHASRNSCHMCNAARSESNAASVVTVAANALLKEKNKRIAELEAENAGQKRMHEGSIHNLITACEKSSTSAFLLKEENALLAGKLSRLEAANAGLKSELDRALQDGRYWYNAFEFCDRRNLDLQAENAELKAKK